MLFMEVFVYSLPVSDIYKYGDCYEVEDASLKLSVAVIQSDKAYTSPGGRLFCDSRDRPDFVVSNIFEARKLSVKFNAFYQGNSITLSLIYPFHLCFTFLFCLLSVCIMCWFYIYITFIIYIFSTR